MTLTGRRTHTQPCSPPPKRALAYPGECLNSALYVRQKCKKKTKHSAASSHLSYIIFSQSATIQLRVIQRLGHYISSSNVIFKNSNNIATTAIERLIFFYYRLKGGINYKTWFYLLFINATMSRRFHSLPYIRLQREKYSPTQKKKKHTHKHMLYQGIVVYKSSFRSVSSRDAFLGINEAS